MPICFRPAAGSIIDAGLRIAAVRKLEQYGGSVKHAVPDAGSYSDRNAAERPEYGIPFMIRPAPDRTAFEESLKPA